MKTSKWGVLHWLRRPAMQLGRAFGRLGDRHLLAAMAVTAVNDNLVEGSPPIGPITHSATTVDSNDNGTAINSLTAYVDNETSKESVLYLTLKDATTIASILRRESGCDTNSRSQHEREQRLQRNELACLYHWKRHNRLAPSNLTKRRI